MNITGDKGMVFLMFSDGLVCLEILLIYVKSMPKNNNNFLFVEIPLNQPILILSTIKVNTFCSLASSCSFLGGAISSCCPVVWTFYTLHLQATLSLGLCAMPCHLYAPAGWWMGREPSDGWSGQGAVGGERSQAHHVDPSIGNTHWRGEESKNTIPSKINDHK